jgi:predicted acetyltransferase
MPRDAILDRCSTPEDLDAFCHAVAQAFGSSAESTRKFLARPDPDHLRVLRSEGRVVGGLILIPMGQHFGGETLPMCGVAGVAILPGVRGRGFATSMMEQALVEMRSSGQVLSTLYASSYPLYRRVGYEQAGGLFEAEVPLRDLGRRRLTGDVADETEADRPAIMALQNDAVRGQWGPAARGPYVWDRLRSPRDRAMTGYVIRHGEQLTGYVYMRRDLTGNWTDVTVSDWCASTPEATADLLALCAGEAAMGSNLTFPSHPSDPLLLMLPERGFQLRLIEPWMFRLCDPARALELRPYVGATGGEVHLDLKDPVFPENNGPLRLVVEGGKGSVSPGGKGRLRLDVASLAALFTGHQRAADLVLAGRLLGPAEDVECTDRIFRAPAPIMHEFF